MSGLMNNADDVVECPLCMEPLEVDDLNFYPCTCGYQICRFCWHRIRTDENKLCPACRKEYPENPADFTPLTQEQMIAFKSQKRQRDQQRKQKITENRKHLANVRVVQKNLVFVVGLPPRLADADILKKHEYFGKYGKIHKVVINPSTTYAGLQGPSASAYVTYVHNCDALRAIQSVNNIMIDGRLIKTSLGTTKYCSHFMKNQQCPKSDCMYLHELGDSEASFTKEEMHQGKHQEYEKRLHDALIATAGANTSNGIGQSTTGISSTVASGSAKATVSSSMSSSSTSSTSTSSGSTSSTAALNAAGATHQQKEAWPSLSTLSLNGKENVATTTSNVSGKSKKKIRSEKIRNEKNSKPKSKTTNQGNLIFSNNENHLAELRSDNYVSLSTSTPEAIMTTSTVVSTNSESNIEYNDSRIEGNNIEIAATSRLNINESPQEQQKEKMLSQISSEEERSYVQEKKLNKSADYTASITHRNQEELDVNRSLSASSNNSDDRSSRFSDSSMSDKSSPGSFHDSSAKTNNFIDSEAHNSTSIMVKTKIGDDEIDLSSQINDTSTVEASSHSNCTSIENKEALSSLENNYQAKSESKDVVLPQEGACIRREHHLPNNAPDHHHENILDTTNELSKLNMFDDGSNSFFSSAASFQQSLLLKNKLMAELRQNQMNIANTSHLPDLLNGIDGYQKTTNANEWEDHVKNVMTRNNKHMEEHLIHQHLQQHHQHQQLIQHQEDFLRMHESQKRNNLLSNIGLPQINGPHNDFQSNCNGGVDLNRLSSYAALLQQQQQQHITNQPQNINDSLLGNNLFGANMSKFFDFHKNQQLNQQILNGHTELTNSLNLADPYNNRANSQFGDNNLLTQQHLQKHRHIGKFDSLSENQTHGARQQQTPPHYNRMPNQFTQNIIVDDDLGFDPFIETQKGLAELMENEIVQQQNTNGVNVNNETSKLLQHAPQISQQQQQQLLDNMQRARMPPPGFSHINAFGFGGVRGQNSSKILPFMNMSGNGGNVQVGQHQTVPIPNNWNTMAAFQQQQLSLHDAAQLQHQLNQNQNHSNNDWTAMDPAILSFRQFSTFPQPAQMSQPHQHQQQQDVFMQHLAQQQQSGQGFNSPTQLLGGGIPNIMPNNLLNVQQSSQSQVNASVQGMLEFLKNRQYV